MSESEAAQQRGHVRANRGGPFHAERVSVSSESEGASQCHDHPHKTQSGVGISTTRRVIDEMTYHKLGHRISASKVLFVII
jgi:hypothetical protein